jgi:hypothetical protein
MTSDEFIDDWTDADALPFEEDEEPAGPPLSESEVDDGLAALVQWQTPSEFAKKTRSLSRRCRSSEYFNNPRLNFLRDAYVLAELASLKNADEVRLCSPADQWPDGLMKYRGQVYNIEVTSTHGGKKLGKEYRGITGPTLDPVENWMKRADSIPKHLSEAIERKSKKHYGSPCWLVVYLNINEYGIRQKESELAISAAKAPHLANFVDITVLWKGRPY